MSQVPLTIGISACLIGEEVRYDGGHKFHALIADFLRPRCKLLPFCPEVAAGLGVPRPAVQLIASASGKLALGVNDPAVNVTDALKESAAGFCTRLEEFSLAGFVLKSRSPSCGLGSTPFRDDAGEILSRGDGVFAEHLRVAAPWLVCVEEAWLISEQRCWRFLTACALVAAARYGTPSHRELPGKLEDQARLAGKNSVEILLKGGEAPELDEVLAHYWRNP